MAGDRGNTRFRGQFLGGDLVTHSLNGANRRTDEDDARLFQHLGKGRIFRQETVTGMNSIRPGLRDCLKNPVDDDIGLRRGAGPI